MRIQESRFNERRATQAAARFLTLAGGKMAYIKLIKLLYMLDRAALLDCGRAVTGDEYYSMKNGPVLSKVLNLIQMNPASDGEGEWNQHIATDAAASSVSLLCDPGAGALSDAHEGYIRQVWAEFGGLRPFRIVDHLHETLPEYTKVDSGRVPISRRKILETKMTRQEAAEIEAEAEATEYAHRMFGAR